ncbi:MAG TPA: SDR family oxidoreductase [Candidatus Saccharimonadales bacterium]|nr:SDR family oxidoreductase [Candidatus Saccharimonadales bacterium]
MKAIMELLDLSNKTAIVTGGAVGIGFGISQRLAEAGANVMVADVSPQNLETARQNFTDPSLNIEYVQADVSKQTDVTKMVEQTLDCFGSIDILVNNAGIYPNILVMDMTLEDFDHVLSVNLKGAFMTTQAVAKQMIRQGDGGKIINITSIDALHPSSAGLAHYDASKHGLWGFTKNVALELAPHNISVNAVAPGGVATPGTQAAQANSQVPQGVDMAKLMASFLQRIPMHRMGEPDDIGKAVLFLASDLSSYMNGSQIVVDGGVLLA